MSQESTKEPAFVLEGGCCFVAAVYIKKEPEKMDASELAPFFSGFFFGVLRTLAELRSADCRCGTERVR